MTGPFSDFVRDMVEQEDARRRALLLKLARLDGQMWTEDQTASGWTDHMAEVMYGELADFVIEQRAVAFEDAAALIYNGAGDPEQEFHDRGVHPWLLQRATGERMRKMRP